MKAKISLPAGVAVFAFLALAGLMGLFALTAAPFAEAQEDMTTIEYAENGEGPVVTLTATDPEMDTINWTSEVLTGPDADSFSIDSDGVLTFDSSPDYEASAIGVGNGGGDDNNDNIYEVIVTASDGTITDMFTVNVKVTNVAETGKVTWGVDHDDSPGADAPTLVQFQVGADLIVAEAGGVTDGDVRGDKDVDERLQWYRSPSKTAMGTAIDDATSNTYPVTTDDIGMYIRVEAFYNVPGGREEKASLTSDYPVLGSRTRNEEPKFAQANVTREVSEGKKGMTVGAPVTATDDITNALNYALSVNDVAKFEIDQKTGQITTMVDLDREQTTDADPLFGCGDDYECSVTVTATDSAGAASDPVATVTIKLTDVNEKPTFTSVAASMSPEAIISPENSTDLFAAGRETDEGFSAAEGDVTYAAMDQENRSLTYRLMGPDGARFQLLQGGLLQGGVLSFKEKPDYEMPADANRDNVYEVTVRASDSTTHADRMVRVTVTNVNEAPEIAGRDSVNYAEKGKDPVATFTAADPEGAMSIDWSVTTENADPDGTGDTGGPLTADDTVDANFFEIDSDGILKFRSPPDYEAEDGGGGDADNDNTYHVVVAAADTAADPETGYHKVTVKVTNVAETGEVTWTVTAGGSAMDLAQFQVGAILTASATDGDIPTDAKAVPDSATWEWYSGSTKLDAQTPANIYTVTTDDVGKRIRVDVAYSVAGGREEDASLTSGYSVLGFRDNNEAPEFAQADVDREVYEGDAGMTVGAPVTATDDITNELNYALGDAGADNDKFEIDEKTGQIKTLWDLDRDVTDEATATMAGNCTTANTCVVTVTATDSAGVASNPATVTITLKNVDENPKFVTSTTATPAAASPEAIRSPENRANLSGTETGEGFVEEEVDVTYVATDPDGLNVNLSLMGPDGDKFSLGGGGLLSFNEEPNYEMPTDANRDNVYEVTVRATDGTLYADQMVMVTVANVNEPPVIIAGGIAVSGAASVGYAENGMDAVGTYTARGANAAMARWSLSGDDAGDFRLSSSSGMSTMLMFRTSPDFESAADADRDNVYMVTVKAMEGDNMDTHDVTVTVTDVDELGMLTGPVSPSHMENDEDAVGTYMITGGTMSDTATWMLGGEDANHFMLDDMDDMDMERMLKFRSDPDYEMPRGMAMSDDNTNEYMVTVKAEAGGEMEMVEVTVMVTNVEETGMVTLMPMQPSVGTEITATLTDPDGMITGTTWQWSRSMTMDGTYMNITENATMMAYTPMDDDVGYHLRATVMYTDGHGAGKMQMATTANMVTTTPDQPGTVSLSSMTPQVGVALTANLMDADGGVTGEMWDWWIDDAANGSFTEQIDGALAATYTPMADDAGNYIKARVLYDDGHGPGKVAASAAVMVTAVDPLVDRFDANNNGMIERSEMIAAINAYLFGEGDAAISRADMIEVINLYLFG